MHTLLPHAELGAPEHHNGADVLLQLAAAVERRTTHPVALALVRAADQLHPHTQPQQQRSQAVQQQDADGVGSSSSSGGSSGGGVVLDLTVEDGSFVQEPGSGVAAVVGGRRVAVGTLDWLQRQGADVAAAEGQLTAYAAAAAPTAAVHHIHGGAATELGSEEDLEFSEPGAGGLAAAAGISAAAAAAAAVQGVGNSHSRVYVSVGGAVAGVIDVADAVRHDARDTVERLHKQGIRTVMLSGDKPAAAAEVAAAVGIDDGDVYADVKPAGKKAVVEELKAQGRRVAMVGDGINDTAALAAADVGVAMGGGVDAASEVAKVVLMGDQLSQVADAVHLAKRTLAKINQNLVWAFGYNVVAIPLAAGALLPSAGVCLTPSLSGALMGLSSLAVVSNSLLLQLEVQNMGGGAVAAAAAGTGGSAGVRKAEGQARKAERRAAKERAAAGAAEGQGGKEAVAEEGGEGSGAAGTGGRGVASMLASMVSSRPAAGGVPPPARSAG